jgi:hypothetical protein
MKLRFIGAILILLILACNKDKFQTKPTIKVKDISPTEVTPNGRLTITLECTDKEGDAGGGELTYIRIRTNSTAIPDPGTNDKVDTVHYPVPDFPKTQKTDISVEIPYDLMDEDPNRNDTMFFKLSLKDVGNNSSDTISTQSVVAVQN